MSALLATTSAAKSAALSAVTTSEPDEELTVRFGASSATRPGLRAPARDPRDRIPDRAVLAFDAERQPAKGSPPVGVISPARLVWPLAVEARTRVLRSGTRRRDSAGEPRALAIARTRAPAGSQPTAYQAGLQALAARYAAIASALTGQPDAGPAPARAAVSDRMARSRLEDAELEGLLFFRGFSRSEIAELRAGLRVLSAPRGTRLDTRSTLWIVARGAVQTFVRGGASSCRVRVAGPGRCVAHLSLSAAHTRGRGPVLEAELRERAVAIEVPIARASRLLASDTPAGRRFQAALAQDINRALADADAPLPAACAYHNMLAPINHATFAVAS